MSDPTAEDRPESSAPTEGSEPGPSPTKQETPSRPAPPKRVGSAAVLAPEESPEIAEQRMVQRLRELMRMLVRGLKAKKMYPANNPVLSRILNEMQDGVLGTIEDIGDLRLTVQQADLLYNGNSIYTNPSKRESLAYRFHRDGITEIEFTEGVTPPEINAFLDVLARATEPRGAEEDLVTLLWEQEFSHIRYAYLAIDDLQENLLEEYDAGEGGGEETTEVPWPGQGEDPSQGLTSLVEGVDATGEGSGERSDDWNALIPAVDITERCPAHLLELRPEELAELAEEIHLEHSRPLTEVALEILTEVAENERNADRFADLARALGDLIVIALAEADLSHATQVLATMHGLCAERGVDAVGFLPDPTDLLKQALSSIHHFSEADTTSLPEFAAHLGSAAIEPVCDFLCDSNEESFHPQLAAGLSLLAPLNVGRVRERLLRATGAPAIHMMAALAACPAKEVEPALLQAVEHPEPRVRRDALTALVARGAASRPEVKDRVVKALQDPDPQVRAAALAAARDFAGGAMGESLLGIAEDASFRERPWPEKRAYFETIARVPNPRVRRVLREWASRQNWWPDAAAAERRLLAAWAIARTGGDDDRAFLERHARSIFPGPRNACRRALAETSSGEKSAGDKERRAA
jgi:HEAT repeat protein